ncbi:MAG: hypothetical protein EBS19_11675 [Spirochaetia bacterium]|nr:hypothetical protein [Spirochaetia bacterium]
MANIIIGNLEIMSQDLPGKYQWTGVPNQLELLGGNGWRLPYESEFLNIYNLYNLGIGGFKPDRYWAYSSYLNKAWYYDLSVGYSPHIIDQSNEYYVRLVRNI